MAHYIEDINQPLHTTDNHNGQHTNNTGIHVVGSRSMGARVAARAASCRMQQTRELEIAFCSSSECGASISFGAQYGTIPICFRNA
jgi:hypothetical protein